VTGAPTVYLDHAATTPLRPEARVALAEWSDGVRGNPSGAHHLARAARRALDDARDVLAEALGAGPGDIVFTAGGTEADNLALFGVAESAAGGQARVACSAVEHHAVLEPVHRLGGVVLPVDGSGRVDPATVAGLVPADTAVVSVMLANNEVGTVNPIAGLAAAVREATDGRAVFHTDAVAAFPWLDVARLAAAADLISVSAHKFGGPQGVGVLVVRPGVPLRPRLLGGGQERDRRSGTQNVAGIVAMAAAAAATVAGRPDTVQRVGALRDRFVDRLRVAVGDVDETVPDRGAKVAGNAHLCIGGVVSEELLFLLDHGGVCASAASSCASGAIQLSHVLAAMGVNRERGGGAVRFSLGWCSTEADVDAAVEVVAAAVCRLRAARGRR
jgi:cysteine desulfurase